MSRFGVLPITMKVEEVLRECGLPPQRKAEKKSCVMTIPIDMALKFSNIFLMFGALSLFFHPNSIKSLNREEKCLFLF